MLIEEWMMASTIEPSGRCGKEIQLTFKGHLRVDPIFIIMYV